MGQGAEQGGFVRWVHWLQIMIDGGLSDVADFLEVTMEGEYL